MFLLLMKHRKESCRDPTVLVEQRLDLSRWIPESFGTADCLIAGDETLTIVDLKYGTGIKVESSSSQLKCYALGSTAPAIVALPAASTTCRKSAMDSRWAAGAVHRMILPMMTTMRTSSADD